VLKRTVLK